MENIILIRRNFFVHNKNALHRFIRRDTIRRCGLDGIAVALLEEACHWNWALRFQIANPVPVSLFLVPTCPDLEILALSPALYLPVCSHAFCHNDNGL